MKTYRAAVWLLVLAVSGLLLLIGWAALEKDRCGYSLFHKARMTVPHGEEPVCLSAVGDIMLSRRVAEKLQVDTTKLFPFDRTQAFLKGDVVFGNLEGPIIAGERILPTQMSLRADPGVEKTLQQAGFTVLSTANNHILDRGPRGALSTLSHLESVGVTPVGIHGVVREEFAFNIIETSGIRIAFLALVDPVMLPREYRRERVFPVCFLSPDNLVSTIAAASRNADIVVVSLHAGEEYSPEPNAVQVKLARKAVDAGADIVIGHHPHVVQRVEHYRGGLIFYSLGNFVFDQQWSEETRQGIIAKIFIGGRNKVSRVEFFPVFIDDLCRPVLADLKTAEAVLDKTDLVLARTVMPVPLGDGYYSTVKGTYFPYGPIRQVNTLIRRTFDLDGDHELENFLLKEGRLAVCDGNEVVWETPVEWWVDNCLLADATNDGNTDLLVSVWKQGSFGQQKPFWVSGADKAIKNHLFIYSLKEGEIRPAWFSSNLDRPIAEMYVQDYDGDGTNELWVQEGSYDRKGDLEFTLWRWNGWGFFRVGQQPTNK